MQLIYGEIAMDYRIRLSMIIVLLASVIFMHSPSSLAQHGDNTVTLEIKLVALSEEERVAEYATYWWKVSRNLTREFGAAKEEFVPFIKRMSLDNPLRGVANAPYAVIRFTNRSKEEICFAKPIKNPGHSRSEDLHPFAIVRTEGVPAWSLIDTTFKKIVNPTVEYFDTTKTTRLQRGESIHYPFWVAGGLAHNPGTKPGKYIVNAKCFFLRGDMKKVENVQTQEFTFEVTKANVEQIRNDKGDD